MESQLSAALWPVHPKPMDGEVLSSWLLRVAEGNGLNLSCLVELGLPKVANTCIDIDLIDDAEFFKTLSTRSGIDQTLAMSTGYANDNGARRSRLKPNDFVWVVPIFLKGSTESRKKAPVPFCPSCLTSDDIPYYRKIWRYAFYPVCPKHGLLLDHCPTCGHPFSYAGTDQQPSQHGLQGNRCLGCRQIFKRSAWKGHDPLLERVAEIEHLIIHGITSGCISIANHPPLPIANFLSGFRDLVSFVSLLPSIQKTENWIVPSLGNLPYPSQECLGQGNFERRSPIARAWLLALAFRLFEESLPQIIAERCGVDINSLL